MTLEDFDVELQARGFGSFSQTTRYRYINWGYFFVARRTRWYWEKQVDTLTFDPGEFREALPATFNSLLHVIISSPEANRIKLQPMREDEFFEEWYPLNLTGSAHRGEPSQYFQWFEEAVNYLYILPPPSAQRVISVVHSQKVVALTPTGAPANTPITPDDMDEAILQAALVRCHQRANEPELMGVAYQQLEDNFDVALTEEDMQMDEENERVQPYPWP